MFIFISGTSGSGKSFYAENVLSGLECSKKFYIAALKVSDSDSEILKRVERHRKMRADKGFITIEREKNLGGLNIPRDSGVLIESLSSWLANEMFDGGNTDKIFDDLISLKTRCRHLITVSDDVFSDGVDYPFETMKYIKTLAEISVKTALISDQTIEIFSGLIHKYKT